MKCLTYSTLWINGVLSKHSQILILNKNKK